MDNQNFYSNLSKELDKKQNIVSALKKILEAFEKSNQEPKKGKERKSSKKNI